MKDYKIEVLSHGACLDEVGSHIYKVDTYTLRLDYAALNDFQMSQAYNGPWEEDFESQGAYLFQKEIKTKAREQWLKDAVRAAGLPFEAVSCRIGQIQGEFFALVHIEKIMQIEKGEKT